MKYIPTVNEKLYVYQPCNDYWVRSVHYPYTVESVDGNTCIIRRAKEVYYGVRYFDTLPDDIVDDPNGRKMKLRWSEKKQRWQGSPAGSYPYVAVFGDWDYTPYLN